MWYSINMEFNEFSGKKVLILGLGREGSDTLNFFIKWVPEAILGVADRSKRASVAKDLANNLKNSGVPGFFGENYLDNIADYDIVIKSPGIPIHLPQVEAACKAGKVTSQTKIFFDHCPGTIIGVTGTKGKSTTSALIHGMFLGAGMDCELVGNIGQPVLGYLEKANADSFFVYELSAHQLYGLDRSPHIAVMTNIFTEHLDYYSDYDEYIRAKSSIAIHQLENDFFIYNSSISECAVITKKTLAKKIAYNEYKWEYSGPTKLIGEANLNNAKIAAIVARIYGIKDEVIYKAIRNFVPLPHRLQSVGIFCGIEFYNDSLSTIQESAVAAIDGLGSGVQTLIAGGHERNQPFDKLARKVLDSNIKNLILFLPTGLRIWSAIQDAAQSPADKKRLTMLEHFVVESMDEAVGLALQKTGKNKICLLSAASASFGGFRDYAGRGEAFKASLEKWARCS